LLTHNLSVNPPPGGVKCPPLVSPTETPETRAPGSLARGCGEGRGVRVCVPSLLMREEKSYRRASPECCQGDKRHCKFCYTACSVFDFV